MSLKGKVAIVTGGNSGIGMAIVLALAKQGVNIVIDYVARPEATEALEAQVAALGDQSLGIQADVSKVTDLQHLWRGACGPTPGAGRSGQGGSRVAWGGRTQSVEKTV